MTAALRLPSRAFLIWLRRACLLALLAVVVLFDLSVSLHVVVVPMALVCGAVTLALARAGHRRAPWWGYAAYLSMVVLAAVASGGAAGVTALEQACFLLMVWCVADEATQSGVAVWATALLVCLALLLPQLAGPQSVVISGRVYTYRAVQQWSGYPELGLLCLLGLAGTWALAALAPTRLAALAPGVLAATFALALVVVQSRASLLVGGLVVVWVAAVAALRWRRSTAAVVVGVALLFGGAIVARDATLTARLASLSGAMVERDRPMGMRLEYWRGAFAVIRAHPWVGAGPGRFAQVYTEAGGTDAGGAESGAAPAPPHAHNLLLHVAAESGVPAMSLYALLWARVLVRSWRASGPGPNAAAMFAVHAILLAFFARSLSDHFLAGLDTSFRMSCLLAFCFGLAERGVEQGPCCGRAAAGLSRW